MLSPEVLEHLLIYCDMDGVLVDTSARQQSFKYKQGYDFWRSLPPFKLTGYLWDALNSFKRPPHILTAYQMILGEFPEGEDEILRTETCRAKFDWCEAHLDHPVAPHRFHCVCAKNKSKYAINEAGLPNLLIDDFGSNIKKWKTAGGIGIHHKNIPLTINTLFDMGILND